VTYPHAVIWCGHQNALVLKFNAEVAETQRLHAHLHPTAHHGSAVRSEHEFFAAVCSALDGIPQVLVTGGHTPLSDLHHFIDKHRPLLAPRIVEYQVVDHPTVGQLVALGRSFFDRHARLATPALHKGT
jgi:hypothetical protein